VRADSLCGSSCGSTEYFVSSCPITNGRSSRSCISSPTTDAQAQRACCVMIAQRVDVEPARLERPPTSLRACSGA